MDRPILSGNAQSLRLKDGSRLSEVETQVVNEPKYKPSRKTEGTGPSLRIEKASPDVIKSKLTAKAVGCNSSLRRPGTLLQGACIERW